MFLFEINILSRSIKTRKFLLTKTTFVVNIDAFLSTCNPGEYNELHMQKRKVRSFYILGRYLQPGWHIFVNFIQLFFSFI